MTNTKLVSLLLAVTTTLIAVGCKTAPQVKKDRKNLALVGRGANLPANFLTWSNQIDALTTEVESNHKRFVKQLKKVAGNAELFGWIHFGAGTAGLVSGIAAAALIAASPANAVWVAALSGIAGGTAAFNGGLDTQGFSKAVVAKALDPIVATEADAYTNFSTAKLITLAANSATSDDQWAGEYNIQSQRARQVAEQYVIIAKPINPDDQTLRTLQAQNTFLQTQITTLIKGNTPQPQPSTATISVTANGAAATQDSTTKEWLAQVNNPVKLTVTVTPDIPGLTYAWKKDGNALPGKTTKELSIATAQQTDSGTYSLDITGTPPDKTLSPAQPVMLKVKGSTATISVTANGAPATQDSSTKEWLAQAGTPVKMTVAVTPDIPNLVYTWKKDGTTLPNNTPGQGSKELSIPSAQAAANNGAYSVDITGAPADKPLTPAQPVKLKVQ